MLISICHCGELQYSLRNAIECNSTAYDYLNSSLEVIFDLELEETSAVGRFQLEWTMLCMAKRDSQDNFRT